ncbi:unnamed protein product [Allacma fusca]|uniref:Uncharacterized protein n=2 Tax=Allacma fusca TaxID=39272 RepID=A0A8J2PQP3_9HEXA|nr:unnamed protein product [Allacma fusca]
MAIFSDKTSVLQKLLFFGFPTASLLLFYSLPLEYLSHFKTLSATQERQHRPGFLVDTIGCEIVEMDPFHPSVIPFLENKSLGICRPSLITIRNEGLAYNENHSSYHRSNCCYSEIHRVSQDPKNYTKIQADRSIRISPTCTPISKSSASTTIPSSDFVQISCEENYPDKIIKTMDFLAIPGSPEGHSKETNSKVAYWKDRLQKSGSERGVWAQKPPNVLILGLDSVSRLNMIRSLPKLKNFLEANDFVEMKGYTKVGDNTFPNMMAAMGGMKLDEYPCVLPATMVDNCPFIWKNYSGNKYVTAFLEDAPHIAIFNNRKTGFVKQPVDYYLRTLAVAHYQAKLRHSCKNGMSETEFMLNYLRNLVRRIVNADAPYFLLSWFTALTHDDSNNLKPAEMIFYKALSDLVMDGSFHDCQLPSDQAILIGTKI